MRQIHTALTEQPTMFLKYTTRFFPYSAIREVSTVSDNEVTVTFLDGEELEIPTPKKNAREVAAQIMHALAAQQPLEL